MIMKNAGNTLMGIGKASGENRAAKAAHLATASPLLETSIEGAKGILFNITGSKDLTMKEIEEAAEAIFSQADPDANIIFGAAIDESLNNEIKITLIAAGFDEKRRLTKIAKATSETSQGIIKKMPDEFEEEKSIIKEIPPEDLGEEYEVPTFLRQGKKKLIN